MQSADVTLTITHNEHAPLLATARVLLGVKLDAIEHAQERQREGLASSGDLEGHQAEFAEIRRVVDHLQHVERGPMHPLTARRALADEIVLSTLIAESQDLADQLAELEQACDLGEISARVGLVARLVATLTSLRS